jgi:hypothetical protein
VVANAFETCIERYTSLSTGGTHNRGLSNARKCLLEATELFARVDKDLAACCNGASWVYHYQYQHQYANSISADFLTVQKS